LLAYNIAGRSGYSNIATAVTQADIPLAPTRLRATTVDARSIRLNWTDSSRNERNFLLYRRVGAASYALHGTLSANSVTFTDVGLQPGTLYGYRVQATGHDGDSTLSNEASAETFPLPPPAPSGLTARVVAGMVQLTWQDNSTNETGFQVERQTRTGAFTRIASPRSDVVAFTDSTAAVGVPYSYRVRAVNLGGEGSYSNTATALVLPSLATFTVTPSSVKGGKTVTGVVSLNGPAPAGGAVVKLTGNAKLAPLPASVTVAAGASNVMFRVRTRKTKKTKTVVLTATYNASTVTARLKVKK
jgi:hypothetical protein